MTWQFILGGFLLGSVSSLHCVGMCGPIALALPVHYLPSGKKVAGIVLYNLGRIFVYASLGLFFGFVGRQFFLGGWQQGFSILLGIILLSYFIVAQIANTSFQLNWASRATKKLQLLIAKYMLQKKLNAMFTLGILNGLLPCGMVYFAVTGALASESTLGGMGFMAAFGLGTFPAMFALSYFGSRIPLAVRNKMKKAVPYFILIMGVLLILRGLNLNIPYVSPYLQGNAQQAIDCN